MNKTFLIVGLLTVTIVATWYLMPSSRVDFNTQVKPLINKNCIICHGGVKKKAGFSLLFRQDALEPTESGKPAIVPGHPDESEMIRRLTLTDTDERMPYKHDPLPDDQIAMLRQWIGEGASWGDHWAYVPVQAPSVPKPSWFHRNVRRWAQNDVDYYIWKQWGEKDLESSPPADKWTLLRRVSLDLTGLPADSVTARSFLEDQSPAAYEKLVDRLLSSPRFGEHWTALWLDLSRYADTKGYERDYTRKIWRYRDWLVRALNGDKPYDQFITEQLAGDLLPNATDDQLVATAFHRNTMTNDEGGTENEEFRTAAVLDRVNTTWEALMGTTFACTQCHSHPYDPFRHEEYYKFAAFFNNTRDEDTGDDYPLLTHLNRGDSSRLADIQAWIAREEGAANADATVRFIKTWQPSINSLVADKMTNSALADTKWLVLRNHGVARLPGVTLSNEATLIYRSVTWAPTGILTIHLDQPDGPVMATIHVKDLKGDWSLSESPVEPNTGVHDLYLTYENSHLKKPDDNGIMLDWFYFTNDLPGKNKLGYDSIRASFWRLLRTHVETTPVMIENPPSMRRKSYVFERGNWLMKGKEVEAGTPHSLIDFPSGEPRNRLGLAHWMTSKENPLTARTLVNRVWERFFGAGLAETLEDLGTQGIAPTHPELLDYLAWTFMNDDKWSLKSLMKSIVMSATYRQDSRANEKLSELDPANKYYARGPRVRLTAEEVRDQALFVSGLLSNKMYGPGVMPYQPKGIWQSPYNELHWTMSKGEDRYRRAIYTFWKRTNPYPSMILFDGMPREVCTARRIRTNTPLQALVTLNDSVYVEAARSFALRVRKEVPGDVNGQIRRAYQLALGHDIDDDRFKVLTRLYQRTKVTFRTVSNTPVSEDPALEMVMGAILNLDEFLTKN